MALFNDITATFERALMKQGMELIIRTVLLLLLLLWCFEIVKPFLIPLIWGGIIAIAICPLYDRLMRITGAGEKLMASLISLLLLAVLILPMVLLSASSVDIVRSIARHLQTGDFSIEDVRAFLVGLPLIGNWLKHLILADDLQSVIQNMSPFLKSVARQLFLFSANIGTMLLQFVIAIFIAGFFLVHSETTSQNIKKLAVRLSGERGETLTLMARATVSSVVQGVLGVAFLQAVLSGIGMGLAGVSGASLLALLILIIATVQLPPLLILGPVAIYLFMQEQTTVAIVFLVWSLFIVSIDAILKPMLLGRGVQTPMLVILMGAIGGMLSGGLIGLFVGAVVLSLGYELFVTWLDENVDAKTT